MPALRLPPPEFRTLERSTATTAFVHAVACTIETGQYVDEVPGVVDESDRPRNDLGLPCFSFRRETTRARKQTNKQIR